MFTGIIETTGHVLTASPVPGGRKLSVDCGIVAGDAQLGASIAVNGVCLTVSAIQGTHLSFDVITETLDRTNLGALAPGARVNLERSLQPTGRIDGHFVQGHIDGTATVTRRVASASEWVLWLRPDANIRPYIIPKGSVAIDGISLTIAAVEGDEFSVAIIPTTLKLTNFESRQIGDRVNIESDIIARTIVHQLQKIADPKGVTLESLSEHGFL